MSQRVCLVLLLSMALLPTALLGPAHAETDSRARAYYHFMLAKGALGASQFSRAIEEYSVARDLDPESTVIRVELAEVYLRLRRYRDASREAEAARKRSPNDIDTLRLLAQIHESTGDTEKAIAVLRTLVEAHPDETSNLIQLALMLDRDGRSEESVELLVNAVQRDPGATDVVVELVERFRALGRLDRAIALLEQAIEVDPENLFLYSKLTDLQVQIRDGRGAVRSLTRMVEVAPMEVGVVLDVARSFERLGQLRRASVLYARALSLRPDDPGVRLRLASLLTRLLEFDAALAQYRLLLEASPVHPSTERFELLKRIGVLEKELGSLDRSLAALEQAAAERRALRGGERLEAPEDELDFLHLHARVLDMVGRSSDALRLFEEQVGDAEPGDPTLTQLFVGKATYLLLSGRVRAGSKLVERLETSAALDVPQRGLLAQAFLRSGDRLGGQRMIRAAVADHPTEETAIYLFVADLLFEVDDDERAFSLTNELLDRYPRSRDLFLEVARRYASEERSEQATAILDRIIALYPDDADLRYQLGALLERLKRFPEAERSLETAIDLDPEHANALNHLAYSWAERGENLPKSLEYAKRAVALEPTNGAYIDSLGWAYHQLGRHEEALESLRQAIAYLGDDPTVREHLGDVLLQLGQPEAALREYLAALELSDAELQRVIAEKVDRLRATSVE